MKKHLILSLAAAMSAACVAAPTALASGGTGGGGADKCAAFPTHSVVANSALDVTASFTVTNCSQSKPEFIDVDLALKNSAGQQLWLTGTGYTQWLAPGQSMSGSFGGLGGFGGMVAGGTYDMQFIARDFSKLDVLTTADTLFTVPAQ